jgi:diguanylate cyclase (GGDEF)-like protein/PAS domain S-box-containing protein
MSAPNTDFYHDLLDNLSEGVYFVDRDRRITYWNKAAERLTGYKSSEVAGSKCSDNILVHVDGRGTQFCTSGCPLDATMEDGIPRQVSVYLKHKGGYRLPVEVSANPIRNGQGIITGAVETFSDNSAAVALNERLAEMEQLALIDKLTGIGNRRFADNTIEDKFGELNRYGWPFGVAFCDIDDFKSVNDRYGHDVGDETLKMVAKTLLGAVRSVDSVFRWGGDEFLVAVTNVNAAQLKETAVRLKALVAASALPANGDSLKVIVSVGCTLAQPDDDPQNLLRRVDALMYQSKT